MQPRMAPPKPMDLRPIRPRSTRVPPLAALLFVVCVLLVFNLSNWRYLREFQNSKQADLEKRLRAVSATVVQSLEKQPVMQLLQQVTALPAQDQSLQLEDFAFSGEYDSLLDTIVRMQKASGLSQLVLITPDGVVVADGSFRSSPGDAYLFTIDSQYIQPARLGETSMTPLYTIGDDVYQRTYHPVRAAGGAVVGLLQASISPDYLQEVQATRGRIVRLWAISSLLLLAIGFSLYRVFGYVVKLERSAMQGARVEAMGALAGGLAHELRNPLAIIRALAEEISIDHQPGTRSRQNAEDIVAETQRLGALVSHFLSLSQPPAINETLLNFNDEVSRVVQLLRKGAAETVRVEVDLPVDTLFVRADERALRQFLLNILLNAKEALRPEGGTIQIVLRSKRTGAELKVVDNGVGIPARAMSRIFEPFYSTKNTGTGLGLAISRGIVENMGGSLELRSTEGSGTEVIIVLPLAQPEPTAR